MKVRVLYFASVRDIAGTTEETLELEAGAKTQDLLEALIHTHPKLKGIEPSLAVSVNQEYAARDAPLADGDEVALIPPVSGGQSSPAGTYQILDRTLGLDEVTRLVRRDSSGAVAAFGGVVREETQGRRVLSLEYQAYAPMAEQTMAQIGEEIGAKWAVDAVAILHRIGRLEVGEMSVAIAVAAPRRRAALEACAYAIERLKEIVPIWKKEAFEDGEVWVGHHGAHVGQ
ncbi:MAG: molybdopterin converting factor subunit 1 [bacterium]|nr:molybdopterin converting factor subunit 1 [bacterium]